MATKQNKHTWRFFRAGGVDQVVIERGADVANLASLDLKLWIAVAMPTQGIGLDPKTAAILDADQDGRIRAPDILDAVAWLDARLDTLDDLMAAKGEVKIARITDADLRATAKRVANASSEDGVVTIEEVKSADKQFTEGRFNGDGIITEKTPEDPELSAVVKDVIATYGSVTDRLGEPGVDAAKLKEFFDDAAALVAFHDARASVEQPLGAATDAAAELLRGLAPKIEDYFARCRMAAFDERVVAASHGSEAELAALASKELSATAPELERLPIARIVPNAALPFDGKVNPAFAERLAALRDTVVKPVLGTAGATLTEADFRTLRGRFAAFEAWRATKPATKLDALAIDRVRALATGDARAKLEALVADDDARKDELGRILDVEKLVYLHRDLVSVLRNFVSFSDFYSKKRAIFQAGTLYLDGRACELCVDVPDPAKHATLAALAGTYLAYCDLRRKGEPNRKIVAAFTAGDSDNLMVGRNGVFIDREDRAWDATIVQVIENPISIRQAFWAPYKRFVRLVEEQVAKRASDANAENQTQLTEAATRTAYADAGGAAPGAAPAPAPAPAAAPSASAGRRTVDVGTVAALGVAIGGIGAMVTGILSTFLGLGLFMPVGIVAIILMISSPSMLLAYLKLRRRNLGPILDASGWAVNGLATINVPFGGVLTKVAALPPGTGRILADPYAEKRAPWRLYLAVALVVVPIVAWSLGKLDPYLPERARFSTVLAARQRGEAADAPAEPTTVPASTTPAQ